MTINNLFVLALTSSVPFTTINQHGSVYPVYVRKRLAQLCSIAHSRIKQSKANKDEIIYNVFISRRDDLHKLEVYVNNLARKKIEQTKWNNIEHIIAHNLSNVKLYSPFFICSKHENCACGHLELQGKLYFDENYPKCVDRATKQEISRYITTHKLMSLQTAISKPYLLVSRLNCRHFFTKVSLDRVLSGEAIKAPYLSNLGSKSYEELQYRKYQKQYKELNEMAHIIPYSEELRKDLARIGRLKEKWLRLAKPL